LNDEDIKRISEKINQADAVIVTAANGFSISEGLNLFANDESFKGNFGDFQAKYGIQNIFQGMTSLYADLVDEWKFNSRMIEKYVIQYSGSPLMSGLKRILNQKNYFIITSNTEHHFHLAGFDPNKIFELEGNFAQMHCMTEKNPKFFSTIELAKAFEKDDIAGVSNEDLLPKCENDGSPMRLNISSEPSFIPNTSIRNHLTDFINENANKKMLVLEMGIGPRNQMIKGPMMSLVEQLPEMTYVSINKGELNIPDDIKSKSFGIDGDLTEAINKIATTMGEL